MLEEIVMKGFFMKKECGFTLLELLVVVVIISIFILIAAPTLLNAVDYAKEGAVKANTSVAAASVTTYLAVDELDADDAALEAAQSLNAAGSSDDDADNAKSPFNTNIDAFVANDIGSPGQVLLTGTDGEFFVTITGLDKNAQAIQGVRKTIFAPIDTEEE